MKKNLHVLGIQFLFILGVGAILEIFFDMPEWFSIIIAALVFAIMYFVIQIKGALKYPLEEVSSDGIAGARFVGILFMSLVLPFVLGCYKYMVIDVMMVIAGLASIIAGRKSIYSFLFNNDWEKKYWLVLCGCVLCGSGIFSIAAAMDYAPCTVLSGKYKLVALLLFCMICNGTIPPNTFLAKFATNNYKKYEYTDSDDNE